MYRETNKHLLEVKVVARLNNYEYHRYIYIYNIQISCSEPNGNSS